MAIVNTRPPEVPSTIAVAGGAPNSISSIAMFLTQLMNNLNGWIAGASTAINYLLDLAQNQNPTETAIVSGWVNSGVTITPTSGSSYTYAGCGSSTPSSVIITTETGRVAVFASGTLALASGAHNLQLNMFWGPGTPPTRGQVGALGTAILPFPQQVTGTTSDTGVIGFAMGWWLSGLGVGTTNWFDIAGIISTGFATDAFISGGTITVMEI